MSKRTQIDKITGEPYLDNHYNLYEDAKLVGQDVEFSVLAAAPMMLEALQKIAELRTGDYRSTQGQMREIAIAAIAKATGGEE